MHLALLILQSELRHGQGPTKKERPRITLLSLCAMHFKLKQTHGRWQRPFEMTDLHGKSSTTLLCNTALSATSTRLISIPLVRIAARRTACGRAISQPPHALLLRMSHNKSPGAPIHRRLDYETIRSVGALPACLVLRYMDKGARMLGIKLCYYHPRIFIYWEDPPMSGRSALLGEHSLATPYGATAPANRRPNFAPSESESSSMPEVDTRTAPSHRSRKNLDIRSDSSSAKHVLVYKQCDSSSASFFTPALSTHLIHPTMSSNIQKVLVTGASGFLGSVIVDELLAAGYKVRGTARSGKAPRVQAAYASFGDRVEIVVVEDLATSDLSHALKGVDALIHVGSPLAGKATPEVLIKSAVDGTLRVLDAALNAGVTKVVVTASIMSLASPARIHSSAVIGASAAGEMDLYGVSKTLAEKALWKFASEHPELDVATVHPGYLFGAPGRGQVLDKPADGTNLCIYQLINGSAGRPVPEQTPAAATHVRDAALLHVLTLKASPTPALKPKRIVAVGPDGHFTWVEAVQWLSETRPELRPRLPTVTGKEKHNLDEWCRWDASSAKEIVGLERFRGWKEMVGDAIDGILQKEKELGIVVVQ
ncbi:hypothetical protein EVG20_g5981 [Dentipellis fragilis]|uniref:NAD-dependent epimerase/dehydratase domain-containing protein n=1 Tax=Dentipellis fragilis TaxID=205917 RepID=A0A4Y9YPJ8_9AGAM|nr:hypothetical protein EVG20_g5981 [Dentipellis fragilis]